MHSEIHGSVYVGNKRQYKKIFLILYFAVRARRDLIIFKLSRWFANINMSFYIVITKAVDLQYGKLKIGKKYTIFPLLTDCSYRHFMYIFPDLF